jgi:hypothetical protein
VEAAQDAPEAPVAGEGCGTTENAGNAPALPPTGSRDSRTSLRRVAEAVERLQVVLAQRTAARPGTATPGTRASILWLDHGACREQGGEAFGELGGGGGLVQERECEVVPGIRTGG